MHLDAAAFVLATSILPARRSFPDWRMPIHAEQRLLPGSNALSGILVNESKVCRVNVKCRMRSAPLLAEKLSTFEAAN